MPQVSWGGFAAIPGHSMVSKGLGTKKKEDASGDASPFSTGGILISEAESYSPPPFATVSEVEWKAMLFRS